jgi:hypothetical protein
MGIVFVNVTCPIVTQILVDPNQSLGIVAIPMTVYDVEPFSRVSVEQMQAVRNFRRTPTGRDPRTCRKKNNRYESEPKIPSRVGQAAPQSLDVQNRPTKSSNLQDPLLAAAVYQRIPPTCMQARRIYRSLWRRKAISIRDHEQVVFASGQATHNYRRLHLAAQRRSPTA